MEKVEIKNKDPFILRAIEHWLDSSNELGYQPLFCEWLITQDYHLKYSIKNTHFEQGKDVVAVSKDGIPHGYQLKGGNINLKRWREEVKPEIDTLIDTAIQHPDIDKNKPHVSYLVTNGFIEDNVRVEIVALNEKRWKDSPLHTITRGDLLNGFQGMSEGILPKDVETYKRLIDLIFADGTGLPDILQINSFLFEILSIENNSVSKEQRKRDIAAAILYSSMIAGPYQTLKNHNSVVQIMVLLLSLIFHLVDKYSLDDKYWIGSYKIIWDNILFSAKLLENEINLDGFDSALSEPLDIELNKYRIHSSISTIFPLKLSQLISRDEGWRTILDSTMLQKYQNYILIWGEASLIPHIILGLILKNIKDTEVYAINIFKVAILKILELNGRSSKDPIGLIPPFYTLNFAVKLFFGIHEEKFEFKFRLSSYLIKPLIEIMASLNQKGFISNIWREISFFHFQEFIPDNSVDYLLYKTTFGENRSTTPQKEKSWNELVFQATQFTGANLPPTMKRFPDFLPFFISLFPHRANSETLGFLYKISN